MSNLLVLKSACVDHQTNRFYMECKVCGKRFYAGRLPILCRGKGQISRFEQYKGKGFRQNLYTKANMSATMKLKLCMNYCDSCGKWVCDECYNIDVDPPSCQTCIKHTEEL